jgi:Zn-dependent M28 family amino/carboxypeptidase
MKLRLFAIGLLALPASLCAQVSDAGSGASTITEADLIRRIGVMANDSMRGRDTPSPELDKAATWIASEFEGMGLRGGAADRSFVQRYPLGFTAVQTGESHVQRGDVRLDFGPDVLPAVSDVMNGETTAPLVLVSGSGEIARGLADGVVRGSHVLLVPSPNSGNVQRELYRMLSPLFGAGAASVLVVTSASDAAWAMGAPAAMRSRVYRAWVGGGPRASGNFTPVLQLREAAAARLIEGSGYDLAALGARWGDALRVGRVSGPDVTVALNYAEEEVTAPNVLAVLEGSDPELRDEYVIVSAHMDHVGVGLPDESGDSIYNGADDNASGTSSVIEIAEAMASLATPPRRSMAFVLVSGEEKGLWGSEYLAANSPIPLDQVVADLNMDMVGRNWPDTIVAIGKEHSDLGETLERVNRAHPELGMTAIDDLWPEESFYTRSDHFNFAREGVPILFFFNGVHEDYHMPSDEPDLIDAEKAARIAKLVFYLAVEVADADERPRWDPGSYRNIVRDR